MRNSVGLSGDRKIDPEQGRMANTMAVMGFNPFREQRKTLVDVAMMIVAIAAAVAAVLWAALSN
jgi:hypothetical protein